MDWLLRQGGSVPSSPVSLSLRVHCAALWSCLDDDPRTPPLQLSLGPAELARQAAQHLDTCNRMLDCPGIMHRLQLQQVQVEVEESKCAICGLTASEMFDVLDTHNRSGRPPFEINMEDIEMGSHQGGQECHGVCVVWCPRVYEKDSDGELMFVNEEIRRGKRTVSCW